MAPVLFDLHVLYRLQARISNFEHINDGMQPYGLCRANNAHLLSSGVMRSNQNQQKYASFESSR